MGFAACTPTPCATLRAHELYREGFSLEDNQQQLGHSHARTHRVYLQRVAPDVVPRIRHRRWAPDADAS